MESQDCISCCGPAPPAGSFPLCRISESGESSDGGGSGQDASLSGGQEGENRDGDGSKRKHWQSEYDHPSILIESVSMIKR